MILLNILLAAILVGRPHIVRPPGFDYCAAYPEPGRTDYKVEAHRYASCNDGQWRSDEAWIASGKRPCYVPEWKMIEGRCDLIDEYHHQTPPVELDFAAWLANQADENGKRLYDVPSVDCTDWIYVTPPKAKSTYEWKNAVVVFVVSTPLDSRVYRNQIIAVDQDCVNCKIPVKVPCLANNVSHLNINWVLTWPDVPITPQPPSVPPPNDGIYYIAQGGSPPSDSVLKSQGFKAGDNIWFLRPDESGVRMWQVQPPGTGAYPGAVFGRTIQ